jgi:hypothetical protein
MNPDATLEKLEQTERLHLVDQPRTRRFSVLSYNNFDAPYLSVHSLSRGDSELSQISSTVAASEPSESSGSKSVRPAAQHAFGDTSDFISF